MKTTLLLLIGAAVVLEAQAPRAPERLSAWPYFKDIQTSVTGDGLRDFVLDRDMLDHAHVGHSDVRLYSGDQEIPYVLRIRHEVSTAEPYPVREFNRSTAEGVAQVSCDLGQAPQEHNEVQIQTAGNNFRRLVDVQGSSDGTNWATLVSGSLLFRFAAGGRTVEQQAVTYSVSRYRYLRLRVSRDPQIDHGAPEITGIQVRRSVHRSGEFLSFPANVQGREPDRLNSRPVSVWRMDLGAHVPFERILISTSDAAYSRPFQLEAIDETSSPEVIASGDLVKREDATTPGPIDFTEHFARHLKLTVTDDRNAPLTITNVMLMSAAREVIFEASAVPSGSVRVYYGNGNAPLPHYDLATRLPAELSPPPQRLTLSAQQENPNFSPDPLPFSERSPWLIYIVLATATLVLCWILLSLVRKAPPTAPRETSPSA